MDMAWWVYPAVIAAGFACGFINTLAGSGSLITLPLLIFIGLPANVANGTNRVGVLIQNAVAAYSFDQRGMIHRSSAVLLAVPAIFGSIVGAQIAVNLDEEMMRRTIGVLMVVMLGIILFKPNRWLQGHPEAHKKRPGWLQMVIFFAIGVYGGFIQAGVGIFLLAGLVLSVGYDLVRANAVKVVIILLFTISAMAVFVMNGQVWWGVGLLLAIGNAAGGWVAAKMAVERGAVFVRWLLIAVVSVSALQLLGVFSWMNITVFLPLSLVVVILAIIIIGIKYAASVPDQLQNENSGFAIASLVLGVLNLFSWIIPCIGLPMAILGLIFGYISRNTSRHKMAVAGVVLSAIGFILNIANGIIGAYLGVTGQLF